MLGAIIGDIVGSRFEFNPTNDYNFRLFTEECDYTDDTICTVAIADALLNQADYGSSLHEWCRKSPNPKGGYGARFREWIMSDNPRPYNSFGNGSAMRVSPIAWRYLNAGSMIYEAEESAACTHNHPEGIKGAQAVALAIHYGDEIRRLSEKIDRKTILKGFERVLKFTGYKINIRRANVLNRFDETCQGTVPVALWIISESIGFEDAIRKAVSLGADADTLGAIVGSIAEAIWGVPTELALKAMHYLPSEMKSVVLRFYLSYAREIFPLNSFGDEGAAKELLAAEEEEEAKKKALEKYERETIALVPLKETYAAGTYFLKDKEPLSLLKEYSKLVLVRESDNQYDEDAVRLYFKGKHVGYVPRKENHEIAAMLDAGMHDQLVTYVTEIKAHSKTISFHIAIYLKPVWK